MQEKEDRLHAVVDALIIFVNQVRDNVTVVAPFYQGTPGAEPPAMGARLEFLVNPLFNGGERLLRDFSRTLKEFARDSYPEGAFDELHGVVHDLLQTLNALCPAQEFMLAMLHVADFYQYLTGNRSLMAKREHEASIEHAMRVLREQLKLLTLTLHDHSEELLQQHARLRQASDRAVRKRSGAKRKYTPRQEREILDFVQRPDFDTGRERNGRTCYNVTAAARAWAQLKHPKDMPQSAKAFSAAYDLLRRRPAPNAQ